MAEELVYENWSTGSANDFEQATSVAEKIINTGLSRLGIIKEGLTGKERIAEEISRILAEQKERVKALLEGKASLISLITNNLLEKEKISGDWFREQLKVKA